MVLCNMLDKENISEYMCFYNYAKNIDFDIRVL